MNRDKNNYEIETEEAMASEDITLICILAFIVFFIFLLSIGVFG